MAEVDTQPIRGRGEGREGDVKIFNMHTEINLTLVVEIYARVT